MHVVEIDVPSRLMLIVVPGEADPTLRTLIGRNGRRKDAAAALLRHLKNCKEIPYVETSGALQACTAELRGKQAMADLLGTAARQRRPPRSKPGRSAC
jgi:hypothetical protein